MAAWLAVFLVACNDGTKTTSDLTTINLASAERGADTSQAGSPPPDQYFGEDWAQQTRKPPSGAAPKTSSAPKSQSNAPASNSTAESTWSLVLGTFTGDDHASAGRRMIEQLRAVAPELFTGHEQPRVHPTTKGSMVVYGRYGGRDDETAKRDEQRLKSIKVRGQKLFNRVILTRLDLRPLSAQLHPHDLLSARRAHPNVDPLYTLDVALWDDFDSGKLSYDEIRRSAEAHAAKLRTQGYEAYFYHDDAGERSMVTVGLFDRTAINPTSGLYSDEVTRLVKKFPVRLVNGEPLYELRDRAFPNLGTRPQTPVLVLVPSL